MDWRDVEVTSSATFYGVDGYTCVWDRDAALKNEIAVAPFQWAFFEYFCEQSGVHSFGKLLPSIA